MKRVKKNHSEGKVTVSEFFGMQFKIIKELFTLYKLQTVLIIFFSGVLTFQNYIELKFLECMSNTVFSYRNGDAGNSFVSLLQTAAFFLSL